MKNLFYILWIFCLVSSNISLEQDVCRNYFTYSFYHKRLTWSESRQWCQELGADLVSMETVEEWEYLTNFIQTLTGPGHVEYYIGLRKKSGEWQWLSNNTTVPGENWRWNSMSNNLRKENVHQPSGDGTCVVMYKNYPEGKQGYYNDLPCNSKGIDGTIGFICEETVAGRHQTSPGQTEKKCEDDRHHLEVDHWSVVKIKVLAVVIASVDIALFIIMVFLCRGIYHNDNNKPKPK